MWFAILGFTSCLAISVYAKIPNSCNSAVYCYGPLLKTVQLAKIFNDSKTFVDMKMKNNYQTTLENFHKFQLKTNDAPTTDQVKTFVFENFEEGNELENWTPKDYNSNPTFLNQISDSSVKELAKNLVELWPVLARKVKAEIVNDSSLYSFIPVPNGFVVPGGRFKEYYYWDSYWIIKGLLICDMGETAKGMIENFFHLVKVYGFIPNGGRIYYTNRSQPPLLTKMAQEYYKFSGDKNWLQNNINSLDAELTYWLEKKTTDVVKDGKTYTMAHYNAVSSGPRPESYLEDYKTVQMYNDGQHQEEAYIDLKSGAESGWDFSTRWIFDELGGNAANLSHIQTRRVIPVDLNSFLCEAFRIISDMYAEVGNELRSSYWKRISNHWKKAIKHVLWNSDDGIWYDFDVKLSKPRNYFYVSNLSPLWCGCFNVTDDTLVAAVIKYLTNTGATNTAGGLPTSLIQSGEQWDLPNAWPPLQAIAVQGLARTDNREASVLAKSLAEKWVNANLVGFSESMEMYEKYDALQVGKYGGGGEYTVQSGFGWTNGVVLEFIKQYYVNTDTKI